MKTFVLLDGAMVYGALTASRAFKDPKSGWFEALLPPGEAQMVGPLVIDLDAMRASGAETANTHVINAYPAKLAYSRILSAQSLAQLATHLRCFMRFADPDGDVFALRIADSRVLAYLPTILDESQWHGLTHPFAQWVANDREGKPTRLTLSEQDAAVVTHDTPLRLSESQIHALIDAGEPDALLRTLGYDPPSMPRANHLQNHLLAQSCVKRWQAGGGQDRAALVALARRAFADLWAEARRTR